MTYYLSWLLLMMVGLIASALLFIWALHTGQFSEQSRARYLPLAGEIQDAPVQGQGHGERYAIMAIVAGAGCAFFVTLVLALMKRQV